MLPGEPGSVSAELALSSSPKVGFICISTHEPLPTSKMTFFYPRTNRENSINVFLLQSLLPQTKELASSYQLGDICTLTSKLNFN